MFTGLVQYLAQVADVSPELPGCRLTIREPALVAKSNIGDSIAINGCCLTVVATGDETLEFQAGPETLARTNLGQLSSGDAVNLESSLRAGDALGGHFVTGHIDGVGRLDDRRDDGEWSTLWFRVPADLTRQMVSKGSIAVDGVSLTLVDVKDEQFSVALIPHTLAVTTLGRLSVGDEVNIETDLLAKHVAKLIAPIGK